jgi:hypothetical protein
MKKLVQLLLALSLVVLLASPALAGLAVDFTGVNVNFTNGNWSMGWEFTTNGPVTVQALGFYDDNKDGLTQNHDVGIYNAAGVLLVSTTVLTTDPLVSFFRMHNVASTVLPGSDTYYIMAVTGSENYTWLTNGFTVDPSINFVQDAYFTPPGGVLAFPNGFNVTGADGLFGPNFSTTGVAPLPSTLVFLGSGLVGLIGLARRRLS